MKRLNAITTFFAAIFFFLSGCAALIYQTSWQRLLSLFAGSDSQAMGIIIAAFMVGLGVGHLIGGRRDLGRCPDLIADRFHDARGRNIDR